MQDVDGNHSVKLEIEPSGNAFIGLSQTNAHAQLGVSTERAYLLLQDKHGEIRVSTDGVKQYERGPNNELQLTK